MTERTTLLTTIGLAIGYPNGRLSPYVVLRDLSLNIREGEIVCLLGANGSGKTTLLRTLAGICAPITGEILIKGRPLSSYPIRELAKFRGIVLTEKVSGALLTGRELVSLGRHPYTDWRGQLKHHDHEIVTRAMKLVGVQEFESCYFGHLSDGEKQKLLIARALAQEPRFLLLDEPTAFLDLPRRVEIMLLLKELTRKTGCAVLLATHDLDSALRVADRFWLIGTDGKLSSDIPENIVLNGDLENAFSETSLHFNYHSGSFEKQAETSPSIFVKGDGKAYEWTCRALRRLGYSIENHVVDNKLPIVTVLQNSKTITWHWEFLGKKSESGELSSFLDEFSDIYELKQ